MRYHHQNLTYGRKPLWRHGRAWLGPFAWEWLVFIRAGFGACIGIGGFSIRLLFIALYVRWMDDRHGRFEVCVSDGNVWIEHPWVRQMEWRSSDPWYRKAIVLRVTEWLLGRWNCTHTKGDPSEVYVPMPEGSYRAIATPEEFVWRRRFGITKRRSRVWLDIPGGIPHSGKGENSWDCGDDGLFGIGGNSVEEAIANAVKSSLKSRRKYGHNSKRTGQVPAVVLNANAV